VLTAVAQIALTRDVIKPRKDWEAKKTAKAGEKSQKRREFELISQSRSELETSAASKRPPARSAVRDGNPRRTLYATPFPKAPGWFVVIAGLGKSPVRSSKIYRRTAQGCKHCSRDLQENTSSELSAGKRQLKQGCLSYH
jgi:hypothetical protein